MMERLEKLLLPLAEAIGKNKYLVALRDGFLVLTPLLIAGSIFLLIANFPIPAWTDWLASVVVNQNTGETLEAFVCNVFHHGHLCRDWHCVFVCARDENG